METEAMKLLAAAIAVLPLTGVGLALGRIFSSYNEALGRNPNAKDALNKNFILTFAFTESIGIFALGISFFILIQ